MFVHPATVIFKVNLRQKRCSSGHNLRWLTLPDRVKVPDV